MNSPEPVQIPETRPAGAGTNERLNSQALLLRLGFAVGGIGSGVLAWWSLTSVLAPRQKESRDLSSTVAQLSAKVEAADRKWTKAKTEDLDEQFARAQSRLIV